MNPFAVLPLELTTRILIIAQAFWPRKANQIAGWIRLAAVCHSWRVILMGTPTFWTDIKPPYSIDFVRSAIERSAPHIIKSCTIDYRYDPSIPPLILSHSDRLALLCMIPRDESSLSGLANFSFGMLRYLALFSPSDDQHLIVHAIHRSLYQVTTLSLRGVTIPLTALSAFRALRRLSMEYRQYGASHPIPFRPFLDMLQGLDLRELVLDAEFRDTPSSSVAPFLTLPSLNLLHFEGHIFDAAVFLSALSTMNLRRFQVFVYEHSSDDQDVVAVLFLSNIRRFTTAMQVATPRKIFAGPFSSDPNDTFVEIKQKLHGDLYFLFTLKSYHRCIARHLALVVQHLQLDGLQRLDLNADSLDLDHVPPHLIDTTDDWHSLLSLLPRLTELHIQSSGVLLDGLPVALNYTNEQGDPPCLELFLISFSEGGFYRHQCQLWRDHLDHRNVEGLTVDTLRFNRWSFPRYPLWVNSLQNVCNEIRVFSSYEYLFPIDDCSLQGDSSDDDYDDSSETS